MGARTTTMMMMIMTMMVMMMMMGVKGQVYFRGACPIAPIIKDFDLERYLGRWFEQERYFVGYQEVGRCWSYTFIKDYRTGNISLRTDFWDILLNHPTVFTGDLTVKRPYSAPNFLTYTLPGVPVQEYHVQVLATDYDSWTLVYRCAPQPIGHDKRVRILTRSPHPPYHVIEEAKTTLISLGIDVEFLEKEDTSCYKHY